VVLFAPWISVMISETSTVAQGFWIPAATIDALRFTFVYYAGTEDLWILFLALSVLSLFTYRKVRGSIDWKAPLKALKGYAWEASFTKDYSALYLLAVFLLAINVVPFVISRFTQPIYFYRYTIAGSAALYLIVAKGISHLNYRYAKLAVVIVLVALSAVNLQAYYLGDTRPQARQATDYINQNAQSGDLVLVYPRFGPQQEIVFGYYYHFMPGVNVTEFPSWPSSQSLGADTSMGQGNANNTKELQSDISGHNRVWLVVNRWLIISPSWNPQDFKQTFQTFNNASYNVTAVKSFYLIDVYLFEKQVDYQVTQAQNIANAGKAAVAAAGGGTPNAKSAGAASATQAASQTAQVLSTVGHAYFAVQAAANAGLLS
jgi:cellobiose-specific phosphotransferase system component IIB